MAPEAYQAAQEHNHAGGHGAVEARRQAFLASLQGKRSTIVAPVGKEPRKALHKVKRQFNAAGK